MRTPVWTDGLYLNAAVVNPAFADLAKDSQEAAGVWALPGLIYPDAVTWGTTGMVVSGTMPAPFAALFPSGSVSGLVVGAHGTTAGLDSNTFSVNLAPLVPASGPAVTAYIYATSGLVQQAPAAIVGPPQSNPAFSANFVPFLSYTESVATIVVSASITPPNQITALTLATTPLTSGQSSISLASLSFASQQLASTRESIQTQSISGSISITAAQAGIVQVCTASGITITMPAASTVAGRVFTFWGGQFGNYSTIQANGSDAIFGIQPGSMNSIALRPGSKVHMASNGSYWEADGAGLAPLVWTGQGGATAPPVSISISASGGVSLPYPTTISGQGNGNALIVSDPTNSAGANIELVGNGGTTPNKFILARNGILQFANSAYTAIIATLSDVGAFTITGLLTAVGGVFSGLVAAAAGLVADGQITGGKGEQIAAQGSAAGVAGMIRWTCPNFFNMYARVDTDGSWNLVNSPFTEQIFTVDQSGNVTANSAAISVGARGSGNGARVVNLNDFQFSGADPGYVLLPNGVYIQFGQQNTTGNITVVPFPVTFPNTCLSVLVNEGGAGSWTQNPAIPTLYAIEGLSRSTATVVGLVWQTSPAGWIGIGTGKTFNWLAIGY